MSPLIWLMAVQAVVTEPGVHELELEREGAETVLYTLSLPEGFEPETPRPLVVALHYGGRDRDHFGRGVLTGLVEPAFRSLGAIIAAPDAIDGGWNSDAAAQAVVDLIDDLSARYPIDTSRTVLTGYSLGGIGTWSIASRHPDRFSAAVPIAGAPRLEAEEHLRAFTKLPVYAIHSRQDTVVAPGPTEEAFDKLDAWGAPNARLVLLSGITHYEVPAFVPHLREAVDWIRAVWEAPQ